MRTLKAVGSEGNLEGPGGRPTADPEVCHEADQEYARAAHHHGRPHLNPAAPRLQRQAHQARPFETLHGSSRRHRYRSFKVPVVMQSLKDVSHNVAEERKHQCD
ncbi:unnamed protein product [Ixodes persulcatus]